MLRVIRLLSISGWLLLAALLSQPCAAQSMQERVERITGPVRSTSLVDGTLGAYGVISNDRFRRRGQIDGIRARNEGGLTSSIREFGTLARRDVLPALGGSNGRGAEYALKIFDVRPRDLLALLDSTIRADPSTYAWLRGSDARVVTRVVIWVRGHDESSRNWQLSGGSILSIGRGSKSGRTVMYRPNSIAFYQTARICWSADGRPISIIPEWDRCPT